MAKKSSAITENIERAIPIQVSADGTAKVMSCGKPETGYASGGRPWEFLRCYESRQLQNGDLISLDKNDLESAMFTCYVS